MIQLTAILVVGCIVFGIVGYSRAWNKEIIATAGIILGIFALFQFDDLLRNRLLAQIPREQVFIIQAVIFISIVFFAYQTRALGEGGDNRDELQSSLLGLLMGLVNGYLIFGTLWYFLDRSGYTLSGFSAPQPNTANAATLDGIRALIEGGAGGQGEPITVAVIILFVIVLIVI